MATRYNTHPGDTDFVARLSENPTVAFQAAVAVLRHREDAEDVAQDAIARAFRNYRQLRQPDRFPFWLARIARRLAINYRIAAQRRAPRNDAAREVIDRRSAVDMLLEQERAEFLYRSIQRLPRSLRTVTVLVGLREQPIREVALLLRVSEGTVKKQLFVARSRLRRMMRTGGEVRRGIRGRGKFGSA
jgi:RNA polymerase sigma-70 factor (ECF subfamily)